MVDYDFLLEEIQKNEICKALNPEEIKRLGYNFPENSIVWEIDTVISYKGKSLSLIFYVNFPNIFPYSFPKIFIEKTNLEISKYIPHINKDYSICILDDGLNYTFSFKNINNILLYMIHQAKNIIKSSEDGEYCIKEFKREFKAYWEIEYCQKDQILNSGLHLITNLKTNDIHGIKLKNKLNNYEYIIYNNGATWEKIKEYLLYRKLQFDEVNVVVIENIFTSPPYNLTFKQSLEIIKKDDTIFQKLKKEIKSTKLDRTIIVFTNLLNGKIELYGWTYKDLIVPLSALKGTRKNLSDLEIIDHPIFGKSNVSRITFDDLSKERLQLRTSGGIENHKSIVVSGLGSIGSNLFHFLQNFPINKFNLIDEDILKLENINRHYSGFNFINYPKVEAIKDQIYRSNPYCEIEVRKDSIQKIINNFPQFINECNFHIVAIGNTMVENYILNSLVEGKLTSPIIIFFVEPYLASGHMIYINPKDANKAIILINEYNYYVLSEASNPFELIYMKEGTCQSGYFPYSSTNVLHFLSSTFPFLRSHIIDGNTTSTIYSWIGDLDFLKSKNLKISDFAKDKKSFELTINLL